MTPSWLDLAVENWARWHWSAMRWHRRRIRSIEGRYRSPQPWDAPPITPLPRVNVLAAEAVEDAWKDLPFKPKIILKQWFVLRLPLRRICRSLKAKGYPVEERYWDIEINYAKLLLGEQLAKQDAVAYKSHNVVSPTLLSPTGGLGSPQAQAA